MWCVAFAEPDGWKINILLLSTVCVDKGNITQYYVVHHSIQNRCFQARDRSGKCSPKIRKKTNFLFSSESLFLNWAFSNPESFQIHSTLLYIRAYEHEYVRTHYLFFFKFGNMGYNSTYLFVKYAFTLRVCDVKLFELRCMCCFQFDLDLKGRIRNTI